MSNKTYVPHAYQDIFHKSPHRFRGCFAGRRGGKSYAGGVESVYWMDRGRSECCGAVTLREGKEAICPKCMKACKVRPVEGMVVAPTYQDLLDVNVPLIMDYVPEHYIDSWNKQEMRLRLHNGASLVYRSADNPDKIGRGKKFDFIWLDEARDFKDFNLAWETMLPTLADYSGHAWVTTTTSGKDSAWRTFYQPAGHIYKPLDQLAVTAQEPHYEKIAGGDDEFCVVTWRTVDNPVIPQQEVLMAAKRMSKTMYRQEYFATVEKFSGLVYEEFSEDTHVIDHLPVDLTDLIFFIGLDVGYTNPTAALLIAEDSEHNLYVLDEWYQTKALAPDIVEGVNGMVGTKHVYSYVIDPASRGTHQTSGVSVLDQINEHGLSFVPGNNNVRAGINRVSEMLKCDAKTGLPKLYILSHCKNLIREFSQYVWSESRDVDGNKKEEPKKAFDHALDALRYIVISRPDWYEHPTVDRYGRVELEFGAVDMLVNADDPDML